VTEAWPEELVVPLEAERLPDVALQLNVLLAVGLFALSFSVAVRTVVAPELMLKVDGEIEMVVGVVPATGGDPTLTDFDVLFVAPPLSVTVSETV
jgi:hypothetical protein